MTKSALCAASFAAVALVACASRNPQPVEPYSPPEATASASAPPAVSSAPQAATAPSDQDLKTEDCRKLGDAITGNRDSLKGAIDTALESKDTKEPAKVEASVDEAAAKVKDLELQTPRLKSWATEYQSLMSDLSDALRRTAAHRAAKDKGALKKDVADVRRVEEKHGDLIKRVNGFCSD